MQFPIVLNVASAQYEPGDIDSYENLEQLFDDIEIVDVANGGYYAFDARGTVLQFSIDNNTIRIHETKIQNREKLLELLNKQKDRVTTRAGILYIQELISKVESSI